LAVEHLDETTELALDPQDLALALLDLQQRLVAVVVDSTVALAVAEVQVVVVLMVEVEQLVAAVELAAKVTMVVLVYSMDHGEALAAAEVLLE
jgi:hypothetical protein